MCDARHTLVTAKAPASEFYSLALSAYRRNPRRRQGEQHKSRPGRRRSSARARGEHWARVLGPLPERKLRGQRKSERDEEHRAGGDEAQLGRIPCRIGLRLERQQRRKQQEERNRGKAEAVEQAPAD